MTIRQFIAPGSPAARHRSEPLLDVDDAPREPSFKRMESPRIEPLVGNERSLGAILIDSGKLTPSDAERVMWLQKEQGLRFGTAAVQLGLVTEADIEFALSRQFEYSYLGAGDERIHPDVIAAFQPFSPVVEQLRALRTQLLLRWFSATGNKMLVVASPDRGEGRSFIAANLAVVFSQLGERVLLVDADLRHPRQHMLFKIQNRLGLSALLSGRGTQGGAFESVPGLRNLAVLGSGAQAPNPQELLSRASADLVLRDAAQEFDVVIVDTPAAALYADAQAVAARAGGALLVARENTTDSRRLRHLTESLSQVGTAVVGSVLNHY